MPNPLGPQSSPDHLGPLGNYRGPIFVNPVEAPITRVSPEDLSLPTRSPEIIVRGDSDLSDLNVVSLSNSPSPEKNPVRHLAIPEALGKIAMPGPGSLSVPRTTVKIPPMEHMVGPLKATTTLAERHPEWPNVTLDIHAGTHSTEADFAKLPQILSGNSQQGVRPASVYLPEGNADTLDRNLYEFLREYGPRLSNFELAELILQRQAENSPLEAEMRTLARGGVIVDSMDAAGENFYGQAEKWSELDALLPRATFDETLEVVSAKTAESAVEALRRDALIMGPTLDEQTGEITAGNFEHTMTRIFEKYPELASEDEVRVAATIHAGHSTVFHRAKAAGIAVSKSLQAPTINFGAVNVLERVHAIGKKPTRELVVKAFAALAINQQTQPLTYNARITGNMAAYYGNEVVRSMEERDVRKIHDAMGQDRTSVINVVNAILSDKGMHPLATNTHQVRQFLEQRGASYAEKIERAKRITRGES